MELWKQEKEEVQRKNSRGGFLEKNSNEGRTSGDGSGPRSRLLEKEGGKVRRKEE